MRGDFTCLCFEEHAAAVLDYTDAVAFPASKLSRLTRPFSPCHPPVPPPRPAADPGGRPPPAEGILGARRKKKQGNRDEENIRGPTALGVPRRSPIQVLTEPDAA